MKRFWMVVAAALMVVGLAAVVAYTEPPMTRDQALVLVGTWTPEQTAKAVMALDAILKATPEVTLPKEITLLDGRDLVISHDPKWITVDVKPYLHYQINLEDRRVKDFSPAISPWPALAGISLAALVAVIADELLPLPPFVKQAAAVGLGAAAGGTIWLLTTRW